MCIGHMAPNCSITLMLMGRIQHLNDNGRDMRSWHYNIWKYGVQVSRAKTRLGAESPYSPC